MTKFIPSIAAINAQEALDLYVKAFKGETSNVHYNTEMPGIDASAPDFKKCILHAEVHVNGEPILHVTEAMTVATEQFPKTTFGDNISVSVVFEDAAKLDESYNLLKNAEGTIEIMPLGDTFFGRFGMVKDKFNVIWGLVKTNPKHS
ncbi:MAG: VOC family protein [Alphaproteobacteria bacterium]|nr:VOC family protein [Alphaproteobacteria bacterium]